MSTNLNPIINSPLRDFIDDLIVAELPFIQIAKFAEKHGVILTADQIEEYTLNHLRPEEAHAIRVAQKKQRLRESDQAYEKGQVALQNSIDIINHLLEQTTYRWKLLLEQKDNKDSSVKEKDILNYIAQIRETAKTVHDLNNQIKDDNYIPIHVFHEEIEKFIGLVINFLVSMERRNPGIQLKDQFLSLVKDKYKQLELGVAAEIEGTVE